MLHVGRPQRGAGVPRRRGDLEWGGPRRGGRAVRPGLRQPRGPDPRPGARPEAIKISVALYRTAFPHLHITVEHVIADQDLVVLRWTAHSTGLGELSGIAPGERPSAVTGMTLCRLAGGKIVESWTSWDTAGVLSRLGVTAPEAQDRG
jgi:hypothetical protein